MKPTGTGTLLPVPSSQWRQTQGGPPDEWDPSPALFLSNGPTMSGPVTRHAPQPPRDTFPVGARGTFRGAHGADEGRRRE
ncbi:hypothetical protein GCM10010521_19280 [Streptomyces rameus]|uniref:Uncharacterized protein n=1 Tax=Streptomyces rameus TaxID=68261 RepID=A0ABP6N1L1_9ACTN